MTSSNDVAAIIQDLILRYLLPLVFVAIPIAEIAVFIQAGQLIGLWPTLAGIVLTAVIGAFLIRGQGFQVLNDARQATRAGQMPVTQAIDGAFLLAAAMLLLTPGFLTDAVGFLMLWPAARRMIAGRIWALFKDKADIHIYRGDPRSYRPQGPRDTPGPVIDGESVEIETARDRTDDQESDTEKRGHAEKSRKELLDEAGVDRSKGSKGSPWQR